MSVLPKDKKKLLEQLDSIINDVTNDTDLKNFLMSLYDETANDKYTVDLFGGRSFEDAKNIISVHANLFSSSNKSYRGSKPEMTFDLRGDNMVNLAYLMYLDMKHDNTIPSEMNFETFCRKDYVYGNKTYYSPVYILFGTSIKNTRTDFIDKIENIIKSTKGSVELTIKNNLTRIYGKEILPEKLTVGKDQITSNIMTRGHNMYMGIDQEDKSATITLNIQSTKYNLPPRTNGSVPKAKIIYPLISVANLMDPGKNMLIESAKENTRYSMHAAGFEFEGNPNRNTIVSRLTWNYQQPKFTLKHDNGETIISAYYTPLAKTFTKDKKKKKTKRGYAYLVQNKGAPNGGWRLASNVSKKMAATGTTGAKLAKFFGDYFQALTIISYIKNNRKSNYHFCLGTGDAMLANNFIFMCSVSGVSPNLWMALSTQQKSTLFGKMIDNIKVGSPEPTLVQNAPLHSPGNQSGASNNRNGNQSGSSGNRSGASRNRNLARMLGLVAPEPKRTPIEVVNANNSNNNNNRNNATRALARAIMPPRVTGKKRKREPPVRGPNAQSGIGASGSTIANNGYNSNANSVGNSRPMILGNTEQRKTNLNRYINNLQSRLNRNNIKHTLNKNFYMNRLKNSNTNNGLINIKTQVKKNYDIQITKRNSKRQKIEKNAAANRNNLLRILKKKNLPSFVIKGLLGNYDNKTKTANQIIREANNFGKTIAAGRTAQRMGTLRPRGRG